MTLNPLGRPKTPEWAKLAMHELTPFAIQCLRNVLDGTDEQAKASDRIKASELVLDRNFGKPLQSINVETPPRFIDTSTLSKDEQDVLAKLAIGLLAENEEKEIPE